MPKFNLPVFILRFVNTSYQDLVAYFLIASVSSLFENKVRLERYTSITHLLPTCMYCFCVLVLEFGRKEHTTVFIQIVVITE